MVSNRRSASRCLRTALVIIVVGASSVSLAQGVNPLILADSLFKAGNYQEAITEYKRHLFLNQLDEKRAYTYYQLGLCYKKIQDWDNSIEAIRAAVRSSDSDSLRSHYKIALAVFNISSGNYSAAEIVLLKLVSFSKQQHIRTKASFFLAINYVYRYKWKEAKRFLEESLLLEDSISAGQLRELLDRSTRVKYKSASKAKWLSTVIPGFGQLYVGKPLAALNAFAVNGAIGYLLYDRITAGVDALELINYGSLFFRYWFGNRDRAAGYAISHKVKKDAEVQQELLRAIDEILK